MVVPLVIHRVDDKGAEPCSAQVALYEVAQVPVAGGLPDQFDVPAHGPDGRRAELGHVALDVGHQVFKLDSEHAGHVSAAFHLLLELLQGLGEAEPLRLLPGLEVNSIALLKSQQTFQQSFYSSVRRPVVLETLLKSLLRFQQSY